MKTTLRILLILCLAVLSFSTQAQRTKPSPAPDIIYYNGHVISMDPSLGNADAIAIKGERIQQVGYSKILLRTAGPSTIKINLNGRTIAPGFVDAHSHLFQLAAESSSALGSVQEEYFRNGITTVGQPAVTSEGLSNLQIFANSGQLQMNIDVYLRYNSNCNDPAEDWFLAHPPTSDTESKLRIAGVKIFTDGGTCSTIAALTFPYPDTSLGYGDIFLTQEDLTNLCAVAHANGYQILLHAQGDSAVNMSLDAIETTLSGQPNSLRHRIDHNAFIDPSNMSRYSEVGVSPVIFGHMPTCAESNSSAYTNYFGAAHIAWLENWRLMHDENPGLPMGWHSDAPSLTLDPIRHMASYVSRLDIDEDNTWCSPPAWLAAHAITIEETLKLMTIGAAYTLNRDEHIGTLTPGKYADLVFLTGNPLTLSPTDLFHNEVVGTMSKGRMVYCSKFHTDLCKVFGVKYPAKLRSVYPNPAKGQVNIQFDFAQNTMGKIKIMTLSGQVVFESDESFQAGATTWSWDCTGVKNGLYILQFISGQESSNLKIRVDQ